MAHTYIHPLQVDLKTGEPYLRLPFPHDDIIVTPCRPEDVSAIAKVLNDPDIYKWLYSPKYPVLEDQAQERLNRFMKGCKDALKELEDVHAADPSGVNHFVGSCPVKVIREVKEDGTQVYIGEFGVRRHDFFYVRDIEKREALVGENSRRVVGDPEMIWSIGSKVSLLRLERVAHLLLLVDYLAKSHQGRGIMSAVIETIMREWMIPRMGAKIIRVEAFTGNAGSVRVFEKNGFVLDETVDYPIVNNSGHKHEGFHVLTWRATS